MITFEQLVILSLLFVIAWALFIIQRKEENITLLRFALRKLAFCENKDDCWCDHEEMWEDDSEAFDYNNDEHHSSSCRAARIAMRASK